MTKRSVFGGSCLSFSMIVACFPFILTHTQHNFIQNMEKKLSLARWENNYKIFYNIGPNTEDRLNICTELDQDFSKTLNGEMTLDQFWKSQHLDLKLRFELKDPDNRNLRNMGANAFGNFYIRNNIGCDLDLMCGDTHINLLSEISEERLIDFLSTNYELHTAELNFSDPRFHHVIGFTKPVITRHSIKGVIEATLWGQPFLKRNSSFINVLERYQQTPSIVNYLLSLACNDNGTKGIQEILAPYFQWRQKQEFNFQSFVITQTIVNTRKFKQDSRNKKFGPDGRKLSAAWNFLSYN